MGSNDRKGVYGATSYQHPPRKVNSPRQEAFSSSLVWQRGKREDTTIVVACICLYRMSRILVLVDFIDGLSLRHTF